MKPVVSDKGTVRVSYKLSTEHLTRAFLESGLALPRSVRFDLDSDELAALSPDLRRLMLEAGFVRFPGAPGEVLQIRLGELPESVYNQPETTLEHLVHAALRAEVQRLAQALPRPKPSKDASPGKPSSKHALLPAFVELTEDPLASDLRQAVVEWAYAYTEWGREPAWTAFAEEILRAAGMLAGPGSANAPLRKTAERRPR